jgi:hypothetical protein
LVLGSLLEVVIQPHQRPIPYQYLDSTQDYILNQEYDQLMDGETVSSFVLMVCFGLLPCMVQLLLAWFLPHVAMTTKREKWDVLHKTLCVYAAAFGTTMVVSNFVKLYVGYLRPIFYDECQPNDTYEECQNPNGDRQIRLSFPSGHACVSVCGMLLLSHYLERCFGAYRHCYYDMGSKGPRLEEGTELLEGNRQGIEPGYARTTTTTTTTPALRLSDQNFPLQRIVSLLCYSPMLAAVFVGTFEGLCGIVLCFGLVYSIFLGWNHHTVKTNKNFLFLFLPPPPFRCHHNSQLLRV